MNTDEAQARVLTLQRQVDLLSEEHAKVTSGMRVCTNTYLIFAAGIRYCNARNHCKMQVELMSRARLRQVQQLSDELQRVTAEAAIQTNAAAQAEARAQQAAEEALIQASNFQEECAVWKKRAEKGEKLVKTLEAE